MSCLRNVVALAALNLAVTCSAVAATWTFSYEVDATGSVNRVSSDYGNLLAVGDRFQVSIKAAEGYGWSATQGDTFYAVIGTDNPDTETGRLSFWSAYQFLNDGDRVGSGGGGLTSWGSNYIQGGTSSINFSGTFDEFYFSGLIDKTPPQSTSLLELENVLLTKGLEFGQVSAVPLPAAAWMFGSALLGMLGVSRRRKSARASTLVAA